MGIGFELPGELYSTLVRRVDKLQNIDPSVIDDYVTAVCADYCCQHGYKGEQAADFLGRVKGFVAGLTSKSKVNNPINKGVIKGRNMRVNAVKKLVDYDNVLDNLAETTDVEEYMSLYALYLNETNDKRKSA